MLGWFYFVIFDVGVWFICIYFFGGNWIFGGFFLYVIIVFYLLLFVFVLCYFVFVLLYDFVWFYKVLLCLVIKGFEFCVFFGIIGIVVSCLWCSEIGCKFMGELCILYEWLLLG